MLTSSHIAMLLRADIQAQLTMMGTNPEVQRELEYIDIVFRDTKFDRLTQPS